MTTTADTFIAEECGGCDRHEITLSLTTAIENSTTIART